MRSVPCLILFALCVPLFITATPSSASAQASARGGAISVTQVMQMLDQAANNRVAQQVLTAYLGGVGEAVGVAIEAGGAGCLRPLTLSAADARRAVEAGTGSAPATPLIVRDMLERAGCRGM